MFGLVILIYCKLVFGDCDISNPSKQSVGTVTQTEGKCESFAMGRPAVATGITYNPTSKACNGVYGNSASNVVPSLNMKCKRLPGMKFYI